MMTQIVSNFEVDFETQFSMKKVAKGSQNVSQQAAKMEPKSFQEALNAQRPNMPKVL